MAIFKGLTDKSYGDAEAVASLIDYCEKDGLTGCIGVTSYQRAAYEMQLLKEQYEKTEGRQVRHYILAFDKVENIMSSAALRIGWKVAEYFAQEYQVVYSVHTDTENIHIHFIINTVNTITGAKFTDEYGEINQFKEYMRPILKYVYGVELY